jgi:hypothetical protein
MRGTRVVGAGQALLLSALLGGLPGCQEEPSDARHAASPTPRATLVLEPPRIGVGQVAELELAVVTPPGHTPRPFSPPSELPGLWLLSADRLPVEKQPTRWVHRTRLRVRARASGRFAWPASVLEVEAPDGSVSALPVAGLPVEVVSILPDYPDRFTPFGVRRPAPAARRSGSVWGPAAAGALAALAGVGLVALARRRRDRAQDAAAEAGSARAEPPWNREPAEPPWRRAREDLAQARERAARDPFAGAHATARALRRYLARRFGADAIGRTSEELAAATPPFAARSRWPAFVAILRGLDEFRFLPESDPSVRQALAARVAALLVEAEAFVEDSTPPEARR